MKLVIDIPDSDYAIIKKLSKNITYYETSVMIYEAIRKATPLPKVFEEFKSEIEDETYKYFEPFNDYCEGIRCGLALAYQKVVDKCLKEEQE